VVRLIEHNKVEQAPWHLGDLGIRRTKDAGGADNDVCAAPRLPVIFGRPMLRDFDRRQPMVCWKDSGADRAVRAEERRRDLTSDELARDDHQNALRGEHVWRETRDGGLPDSGREDDLGRLIRDGLMRSECHQGAHLRFAEAVRTNHRSREGNRTGISECRHRNIVRLDPALSDRRVPSKY